MYQLEQLCLEFRAHLASESERIEKLKEFCNAINVNDSCNGSTQEISQITSQNDSQKINESSNDILESTIETEDVTLTPGAEMSVRQPVVTFQERDLWSNLGQYQLKRDELTKERKQEFQEFLKHQHEQELAPRRTEFEKMANVSKTMDVFTKCRSRNEIEEERRTIENLKYRKELLRQIEENKVRKELERQKEIQSEQEFERRWRRENERLALRSHQDSVAAKMASKVQTPSKATKVPAAEVRSPSYLYVNERPVSSPIKIKPLLDEFSKARSDLDTSGEEGSQILASLSKIRSQMKSDHEKLMSRIKV